MAFSSTTPSNPRETPSQVFTSSASEFPSSSDSELSEHMSDISDFMRLRDNIDERLNKYHRTDPKDDTILLLKAFARYLPRDGKQNLEQDIKGCRDDRALKQLADSLETGLLIPIQALGGRDRPVEISPRLGAEESIENLISMDLDSISRGPQGQLRVECLRRDGDKCMVFGIYNRDDPRYKRKCQNAGPLETAHIVPVALGQFTTEDERLRSSIIWTNIYRYFPLVRSRLDFTSESIHNHENVMTLSKSLHGEFGSFRCSFIATSTPNTYRLKVFPSFDASIRIGLVPDRQVHLTSHDGRYELPSPILLEMHNAIAHVLHATGRGFKAEELRREYESTACLARGGFTNVEMLLAASDLAVLQCA